MTNDKRDLWAESLGLKKSKAAAVLANVLGRGNGYAMEDEVLRALYDHPRLYNHDVLGRVLTLEPYSLPSDPVTEKQINDLRQLCESKGLVCEVTRLSPYSIGNTILIVIYESVDVLCEVFN